ncbi:MAG TPA: hypothetical protein VN886_10135 [Acidimicrobiales bacterium]|nr:hypothetical protein [Acidimicrobiales bacterium]
MPAPPFAVASSLFVRAGGLFSFALPSMAQEPGSGPPTIVRPGRRWKPCAPAGALPRLSRSAWQISRRASTIAPRSRARSGSPSPGSSFFGAYYLLPGVGRSGFRAFNRLAADIAFVEAVLAWQVQHIARARLPELRAIEALGVVIALFLVAFSSTYLGMSDGAPLTFTQSLDHTCAL